MDQEIVHELCAVGKAVGRQLVFGPGPPHDGVQEAEHHKHREIRHCYANGGAEKTPKFSCDFSTEIFALLPNFFRVDKKV